MCQTIKYLQLGSWFLNVFNNNYKAVRVCHWGCFMVWIWFGVCDILTIYLTGGTKGTFIRGTPIKSKIIPWSSQKMIPEWQAAVAAFELYAITQDQLFDPTAPLTEFRSLKRYSKA